jgi:DNA repair photolyase
MTNSSEFTVNFIDAKSILSKASGFISDYDFTLNPYRGCQYACSYCYAAAFSPNSQLRENWGNWVMIKQNAGELLEKELARWARKNPEKPARIYMSSVTDPYQPIEAKQQLTRRLLQIMLPYQPTLVIQTRSPMIFRDLEILQEFERLRINISIPTGSERVKRDFEPQSPSIKSRLQAIAKLRYGIKNWAGYYTKFSITITPLLPTFPEEQDEFITKLGIVDRLVIQDFHSSTSKSLVASTPRAAINLKQKYNWWYDDPQASYQAFRQKLVTLLPDIDVKEGKAGFGYE